MPDAADFRTQEDASVIRLDLLDDDPRVLHGLLPVHAEQQLLREVPISDRHFDSEPIGADVPRLPDQPMVQIERPVKSDGNEFNRSDELKSPVMSSVDPERTTGAEFRCVLELGLRGRG